MNIKNLSLENKALLEIFFAKCHNDVRYCEYPSEPVDMLEKSIMFLPDNAAAFFYLIHMFNVCLDMNSSDVSSALAARYLLSEHSVPSGPSE